MGTEFLLANGGKGMWFDSQQPFVGRSVERQHEKRLCSRLGEGNISLGCRAVGFGCCKIEETL